MTGAGLVASRTASDPVAAPLALDPMARCAILAAAAVGAEIESLARRQGRAGIMVSLRLRAQALSRSALAEDLVMSGAFEAAADDVAWGRQPLQAWLCDMGDPAAVSEDARAVVRAGLPAPSQEIAGAAQALVREIVARCARQGEDAFEAARDRDQALADARRLQAAAFDDPRLSATPALRAVMRCSVERLGALLPVAPSPVAASPTAREPPPNGGELRQSRWRAWLEAVGLGRGVTCCRSRLVPGSAAARRAGPEQDG